MINDFMGRHVYINTKDLKLVTEWVGMKCFTDLHEELDKNGLVDVNDLKLS